MPHLDVHPDVHLDVQFIMVIVLGFSLLSKEIPQGRARLDREGAV